MRFAWWGAEESGLVGSTNYVNGLSQAEKDRIALYLNFDMIGSPNYIQMVYDSDESGFGLRSPSRRARPQSRISSSPSTRSGRAVRRPRVQRSQRLPGVHLNGIAAGGLFTGAEVLKTAAQQAIWGGTAGAQYDPCYHAACDTFANNNNHALAVNADAVAFAMLTYAYSTQSVNGVPGKRVPGRFQIPAPAGPEGTVAPWPRDA